MGFSWSSSKRHRRLLDTICINLLEDIPNEAAEALVALIPRRSIELA